MILLCAVTAYLFAAIDGAAASSDRQSGHSNKTKDPAGKPATNLGHAKPPKYASDDPQSPYFLIERLQKAAYASPSATPLFNDPAVERKAYAELMRAHRNDPDAIGLHVSFDTSALQHLMADIVNRPMPTRFESPGNYFILQTHFEAIERAIKDLKLSAVRPIFGSVPSADLDAQSFAYRGRNVVLLNTQVFRCAFGLSGSVLGTFRVVRQKDSEPDKPTIVGIDHSFATFNDLVKNSTVTKEFIQELLESILNVSIPLVSNPNRLDAVLLHLQSLLTEAAEVWIISHEYGHVISGNGSRVSKLYGAADVPAAKKVMVDQTVFSLSDEIQADKLGYIILTTILDKGSNKGDPLWQYFGRFAPVFQLECMSIFADVRALLETGSLPAYPSDSEIESTLVQLSKSERATLPKSWTELRPSLAVRLYVMKRRVQEDVGSLDPNSEDGKAAIVGQAMCWNLEQLWLRSGPILVELEKTRGEALKRMVPKN